MSAVTSIKTSHWHEPFPPEVQQSAVSALEDGQVLFFPDLAFKLLAGEVRFLTPELVTGAKNISYHPGTHCLSHCACGAADLPAVTAMISRFSTSARALVESLIPVYQASLKMGRTSLRPVEASGRVQSWRKDDTRLHVDAFPTTPLNGGRILRIFSNVNPAGRPRCWRLGEGFEQVASRFVPGIRPPLPGTSVFLSLFRVTKGRRSLYDHYLLKLHDAMKADDEYQQTCPQSVFDFPAQSTWMVYADSVPHAVTSGQHQFEQTIYIPADGMAQPDKSPLRILERQLGRNLRN
jgi:hypothetical protein